MTSEDAFPKLTKANETARVEVRFSPEVFEKYSAAAASADVPLSSWIKMAVASYYGSWRDPDIKREERDLKRSGGNWPSGWPKSELCPRCKKKHDPEDHGVPAPLEFLDQ